MSIDNNTYGPMLKFKVNKELPEGGFVSIVGDRLVSICNGPKKVIGSLVRNPLEFPGNAAIQTRYNFQASVLLARNVSAGDEAKLSGLPGSNGEQRFDKFYPGVDNPELKAGIFVTGGTAGSTAELMY